MPTTVAGAPAEAVCYTVKLANPLPAADSVSLTVTAVIAKAQIPYPAELSQQDMQLMLYKGNLYVMSPYTVSTQTTEVSGGMPGMASKGHYWESTATSYSCPVLYVYG